MDETGRAIEQESCSKRMGLDLKPDSVVTEDVDSIRSKFVLSKAVEGLETFAWDREAGARGGVLLGDSQLHPHQEDSVGGGGGSGLFSL